MVLVLVSVSKFFIFLDSIGFGIEEIWYRKKYRIRYRKKIGIEKVLDSISEIFGIGKSIGFDIGNIWYRKKDSDTVSFRFWVSSHTEIHTTTNNFFQDFHMKAHPNPKTPLLSIALHNVNNAQVLSKQPSTYVMIRRSKKDLNFILAICGKYVRYAKMSVMAVGTVFGKIWHNLHEIMH